MTFTPDEIRAQLRAQGVPVDLIERAIVTDPSVPRDEIHFRDSVTGKTLGKIVDFDFGEDEKEIVARADKQMRALGFIVISFNQPRHAKYLTPGIPDRRYYHPGRGVCLWWEAKTSTGEQSPAQKQFQEWCDACGDVYVLGTDDELYAWLMAKGIAGEEGGLLIPLPYTR